ncbi:MAG: hypothetical protein A2W03_10435 [Candidatus Aminicenantes bacterium RBG_16_63_16]|nr:MAG: hypothetical protein A2W03_10435 [Candidatus Aminicenantes bacterium RBG_16_63_16]
MCAGGLKGHRVAQAGCGADVHQPLDQRGVRLVRDVQEEPAVAAEHRRKRHWALVGPAHNEDAVSELAPQDRHGPENLIQGEIPLGVGRPQFINVPEIPEGRFDGEGGRIVRIDDAAPHGLGERGRPVFNKEHIVPEPPPGQDLGFGHQLTAPEALG